MDGKRSDYGFVRNNDSFLLLTLVVVASKGSRMLTRDEALVMIESM